MFISGDNYHHGTIFAVRGICFSVQSLLGPHMAVKCAIEEDGTGELVGDPLSLLNWMAIKHPVGGLIRGAAHSQKKSLGSVLRKNGTGMMLERESRRWLL